MALSVTYLDHWKWFWRLGSYWEYLCYQGCTDSLQWDKTQGIYRLSPILYYVLIVEDKLGPLYYLLWKGLLEMGCHWKAINLLALSVNQWSFNIANCNCSNLLWSWKWTKLVTPGSTVWVLFCLTSCLMIQRNLSLLLPKHYHQSRRQLDKESLSIIFG